LLGEIGAQPDGRAQSVVGDLANGVIDTEEEFRPYQLDAGTFVRQQGPQKCFRPLKTGALSIETLP
jgi:hypothetical protein